MADPDHRPTIFGIPSSVRGDHNCSVHPIFIILLGIICRGFFNLSKLRHWKATNAAILGASLFGWQCCDAHVPGIIVGAISNGRVVVIDGISRNSYVRPWFAPFPITVGLLALALFAYLAATYLAVKALSGEAQEDFRKRALAAGIGVALCALATFVLSKQEATEMRAGLPLSRYTHGEQLFTVCISLSAFWAFWTRRYQLARVAAAAQICSILWAGLCCNTHILFGQ